MAVSGYLEILTTLLSWHLYEAIWGILAGTGIALIPFAAILVGNLIDAQTKAHISGNAGVYALKKTEVDVYMAFVVLIIACQPLVVVNTNDVIYTTYSCSGVDDTRESEEKTIGSTGTKYDSIDLAEVFAGSEVKVPVWWAFTNNLFRGVTAEAIHYIPCSLSVADVVLAADNMRISDNELRKEILDFSKECWEPAVNKFNREKPDLSSLPEGIRSNETMISKDIAWPGSYALNNLPGYYGDMQSTIPVKRFSYDETRDGARQSASHAEAGYPICSEWWDILHVKLKESAYAEAIEARDSGGDEKLWEDYVKVITSTSEYVMENMSYYSIPEVIAHYMIKGEKNELKTQILSTNHKHNENAMAAKAQDIGAGLGMLIEAPKHFTAMRVAREAAPMVQALLMMLLVIVLPFIMVFSKYSFSTVVTVTFIQFGVIFWSFLFALAYWLDNNLAKALFGADALFQVDSNVSSETNLLNFLSATFYIFFPVAFSGIMTWAGIKIGSTVGGLSSGAVADMSNIGRAGANAAVGAASTVATKTIGKK